MIRDTQNMIPYVGVIVGAESFNLPALTVPKREVRDLPLGERLFYRVMRFREQVRNTQPAGYRALYGILEL